MEKFSPEVIMNGRKYNLTNEQWLLVYAYAGFDWAWEMLWNIKVEQYNDYQI